MKKTLAYLFVLIFLTTSFAEQAWKIPTFGPVEAKPVFFDDKVVIGSQSGVIEYVNWASGNLVKRIDTGEQIRDVQIGSGLIVAVSEKTILILDKSGSIIKTINESSGTIYGIATDDYIYASTGEGLKAYTYNGNLVWIIPQDKKTLTAPRIMEDKIYFGADNELVVAYKNNGSEIRRIKAGQFWKSRPEVKIGNVYIGSTDGKMFAIDADAGKVLWSYSTGGWIMSDPLYDKGIIYFGSNDGNVYALNANTGNLIWKKKTPEAVQGSMELTTVGGKEMLITGSNDNKVYMLETKNGNVTLVFQAFGWVHNPTFYSGMLFFGSYDGSLYAYTLDRSCSIESPQPGENVGYMLFNVSGKVFSQYGGARVSVRVNNGSWNDAQVVDNDWTYTIDPNNYEFGNMFIECKAADSFGEEKKSFTYVVLFRNVNAQKMKMKVDTPSSATEGKDFRVKAYNEDDGTVIGDFQVLVGGKTFNAKNGVATVKIDKAGNYNMIIRKIGYEDVKVALNVGYDLVMIGAVIALIIGVIGTIFYLFVYKKK